MTRGASAVLLLGGSLLVVMSFVAPASSSPQSSTPNVAADSAASVPPNPALSEMNQQVDRLRARRTDVPHEPASIRDPFTFGRVSGAARVASSVTPEVLAATASARLPRLAVILSTDNGGVVVRTAVFAVGDEVAFAKVGEDVEIFRVDVITGGDVELVERASGSSYRVSLQ